MTYVDIFIMFACCSFQAMKSIFYFFFKENSFTGSAYLLLGFISFIYVLIRSFCVGITYDEYWTIHDYATLSACDIITFTPPSSNNHLLYTLLIRLFAFFSDSLFAARLPNLLSFIVYLYFSYKLSRTYLSPIVGITCYLVLTFNPFLLDFFGLARGYGLALSFQMMSLYFTLRYIDKFNIICLILSLFAATMAVTSQFTLLVFYCAVVATVFLFSILKKKRKAILWTLIISMLFTILLTFIIYCPVIKLMESGDLYYGGHNNIFCDTFFSLTDCTLYGNAGAETILATLYIVGFLFVSSIVYSFSYRPWTLSTKHVILIILVTCIAIIIIQHYLLSTLYVIDRTALYLYPLIMLSLFFSINNFRNKMIMYGFTGLIAIAILWNAFANGNTYTTLVWHFDAHTETLLNRLNEKGKAENRILAIDFSWPFEYSVKYYYNLNKYSFISVSKDKYARGKLNPQADYYIYLSTSMQHVSYFPHLEQVHFFEKQKFWESKKENVIVFSMKNSSDSTNTEGLQ